MCSLLIVLEWGKIYFVLLFSRWLISIKYVIVLCSRLRICLEKSFLYGTRLIGENQGHSIHFYLHFSFMQELLTIRLWEICRWQDLQIIGKFYAHWAHTFAIPIPIAFLSTFCSFHFFNFRRNCRYVPESELSGNTLSRFREFKMLKRVLSASIKIQFHLP